MSADPRHYRHDILRHGICVPTSCYNSTIDLEGVAIDDILKECYNRKFHQLGLSGNISNVNCVTNESNFLISFYDVTVG